MRVTDGRRPSERMTTTMPMSMLARGWGHVRRLFPASTKALRSKGYFVLGMHRSGTSCLTGLLETAGLWLGDVPRHSRHNRRGNLEDKAIQLANAAILGQFGGTWDRPPGRIEWDRIDRRIVCRALAVYRARDGWLVKDPRMVLTLEAWLPLVPRRELIGTFRHPLAVARSLHKRSGMPIEQGLALWTAYNRRLIDLHGEHGFPLLGFDLAGDGYLERFQTVCRLIGLPFDGRAASEFYSTQLVSQTAEGPVALGGETAEIYEYLLGHQVGAESSAPAPASLAG